MNPCGRPACRSREGLGRLARRAASWTGEALRAVTDRVAGCPGDVVQRSRAGKARPGRLGGNNPLYFPLGLDRGLVSCMMAKKGKGHMDVKAESGSVAITERKRRSATMTQEDFVRVCTRLFGGDGLLGRDGKSWKERTARALGRRWNTIWCYAAGRRRIPARIAEELWMLERLVDEAEAAVAARTPEERRSDLFRLMDEIEAQKRKRAANA